MSRRNRPITKDMYWFAHGGSEAMMNKNATEEENEVDRKGHGTEEQKSSKDISLTDGSNSSGPPSLDRDDRLHAADKRIAAEERRKLLWEAEQERNDAVMRKHMEREAALEARRNAQRSTISFAFGSSVPRNVDTLQSNHSVEPDCMSKSFTAASSSQRAELHNNFYERRSISPNYSGGPYMVSGACHQPDSSLLTYSEKKSNIQSGCLVGSGAIIVEDMMSRSMTASISAPRGRRKNDLMPTVPYDRTATPRVATSSSSRRRSVSMTRLDQLAQPRKHYVEATKANSTASSGMSSILKDACSPNRPLSSASEHSGGRAASNVTRRVRATPRKPRPVSIAGTIPDQRIPPVKVQEVKGSAIKKTPLKKIEGTDLKKTPTAVKSSTPKSTEKPKPTTPRPMTAPVKSSTPKSATKPTTPKTVSAKPKTPVVKEKTAPLSSSSKSSKSSAVNKKKSDVQVSSVKNDDSKIDRMEKSGSPLPDSDSGLESDKNGKRIISEEEARAALAEKRRLAREQAEREAELERQRQEELRRQEEERMKKEEEEQRKMEEESLRLLEEHRRQEEEKLRKAIEDQEQKKEEERARQEEELRQKAEQDRKAKEESEKIRLELEEKLRREEEERAERKKRLEKIMSRTRGKSSGTSPSGSVSGSDPVDSGDNQQEGFSSGASSLESNEGGANSPSEPSDDAMAKMEVSSSGANSIEANLTYEFSSNDVSLNSNDLMLPASEVASQDGSIVVASNGNSPHESVEESGDVVTPVNFADESSNQLVSDSAIFEVEKVDTEIDDSAPKHLDEATSVDNASESSVKHFDVEQKAVEEPTVLNQEVKSNIFDAEFVEEHPDNDTPKLQNIHYNQFDVDAFKQMEEVKEITDNNYSIAAQSDDYHANTIFTSFDPPEDIQSDSHHADDKFETLFALNPQDQSVPPEHQKDLSSEVQDGLNKPAASGDMAIADELNVDHSANQDSVSSSQEKMPASSGDYAFVNQDQDSIAHDENPVAVDTHEQDIAEQPREIGQNLVVSSQSSEVPELSYEIPHGAELLTAADEVQFLADTESENQNSTFDAVGDNEPAQNVHSHSTFLSNSGAGDAFNAAAVVNGLAENPFASNFNGMGDKSEAFKSAADNPFAAMGDASQAFNSVKTADNPFASSYVSNEAEQNLFYSKVSESTGHFGVEDSNVDKSPDLKDNVTVIKEEGSEKYVGIISSIDNDHFSNDFPNKFNEQLTNNLECASTSEESEDSSLDSNLSQVIATEDVEKDLNNHHQTSNNMMDNPFKTQSIPQSEVDHYSEFEVYSNGHSVESSKMVTDYGILNVENNIFENVSIDKKISSDPFLAKGSSNQISGNPFLMQEEQNNPKVLMTSDFLN